MAIVSVHKNKIRRLSEEGNKKAKLVEKLLDLVSYTHLDVYKRQLLDWKNNSTTPITFSIELSLILIMN